MIAVRLSGSAIRSIRTIRSPRTVKRNTTRKPGPVLLETLRQPGVLRQINGCSFCVDAGWRSGKKKDVALEKLFAVAAWREAPYFTEAERAALALAEAVTRLSDRPDPVPDEIFDEAARHFDEKQLAAIILWIATTNVFNRINVTVRQSAGSWGQ